jgi:hypothetical protein
MSAGLNFGFPDDVVAAFAHGGLLEPACELCGWEPASETFRTAVRCGMFRGTQLFRICACCSFYLHLSQVDEDHIMLELDRQMQQFRFGAT